jgi:hypothetical protein
MSAQHGALARCGRIPDENAPNPRRLGVYPLRRKRTDARFVKNFMGGGEPQRGPKRKKENAKY